LICSIYYKFRIVEREEKIHKIKKVQNKLQCDCLNDLFYGVLCRHQVAIFVKSSVEFIILPFNQRWRKLYYVEEQLLTDPVDLETDSLDESNLVKTC